jgi:hypothetical protein
MTWWEVRRLAITTTAIVLVTALICAAICLPFGAVSYYSMGNALFGAAMVLVLAGTSMGARAVPGGPGMMGMGNDGIGAENLMGVTLESEMLMQHRPARLAHEARQFKRMSWALVLAIAALPVFAASMACFLVFDS